jgi:hypothetical protein
MVGALGWTKVEAEAMYAIDVPSDFRSAPSMHVSIPAGALRLNRLQFIKRFERWISPDHDADLAVQWWSIPADERRDHIGPMPCQDAVADSLAECGWLMVSHEDEDPSAEFAPVFAIGRGVVGHELKWSGQRLKLRRESTSNFDDYDVDGEFGEREDLVFLSGIFFRQRDTENETPWSSNWYVIGNQDADECLVMNFNCERDVIDYWRPVAAHFVGSAIPAWTSSAVLGEDQVAKGFF